MQESPEQRNSLDLESDAEEDSTEEESEEAEQSEPVSTGIVLSMEMYDLVLMYREARERLHVPPGVVGGLLGLFKNTTTEDFCLERDGTLLVVYHNVKAGKRALLFLRELLRGDLQMNVTVFGSEPRPRLGGGRRHPWQRKSLFRTLVRIYRSDEDEIIEDPEFEEDPPEPIQGNQSDENEDISA